MFNGSERALNFVLPKLPSGKTWWRALNTALTAPRDIVPDGKEHSLKPNRPYRVAPRSVVVLLSKPDASPLPVIAISRIPPTPTQ